MELGTNRCGLIFTFNQQLDITEKEIFFSGKFKGKINLFSKNEFNFTELGVVK